MGKKKCPPAGAPDWMVSYGDMMSLLLTFFIMLYAISTLDAKKAETISYVMQDTFGTSRNMTVSFPGKDWQQTVSSGQNTNRSQTVETIQSGNPTRASIPIRTPKETITTGVVTFENDSDTLSNESLRILQDVYKRVKGSQLMIELRGHTGLNERAANRDSMDLAYARAYAVRKSLIDLGVNPSRIIITSMGSNRVSGSVSPTQVGSSNSYVEIFLISETPEVSETKGE